MKERMRNVCLSLLKKIMIGVKAGKKGALGFQFFFDEIRYYRRYSALAFEKNIIYF